MASNVNKKLYTHRCFHNKYNKWLKYIVHMRMFSES